MIRRFIVLFPLVAACAAPRPSPEAPRAGTEPSEAEPTLEERWRAPFAVEQSGTLPPRPPRPEVVRVEPPAPPPPVQAPPAAPPPAAAPPSRPAQPAPAARPPAPAPQRQGTRTHTVGSGDTLYNIGRRYGVSPAAIRAANQLPDDTIRLGQTLVIPPS